MSRIIKTEGGLYVINKRRIDLVWIVKPVLSKQYKYGIIPIKKIMFPNRYVGKRFRIKLEPIGNGNNKRRKK